MSIRIVLADDHRILLTAIQSLLANEPDFEIVGTADNGGTLLKLADELNPDVIVVDIAMPGMNGIEALHRLKSTHPRIKTIVLSGYDDKRFVVESMSAGAAGYVVKSAGPEELPRAIRAVFQNKTYLCPDVAGAVVETLRNGAPSEPKGENRRLAPRERVIVRLMAEGKSSAQIAAHLCIAVSTVETHRRNIMRKLELHNVADITRYAIREGIATP